MNQEQAWTLAREAYEDAAELADEQYAVAIFCAQAQDVCAIGDAEAQFDLDMRTARLALDVARFAWQA
jgi:hypothetical protein